MDYYSALLSKLKALPFTLLSHKAVVTQDALLYAAAPFFLSNCLVVAGVFFTQTSRFYIVFHRALNMSPEHV